MFNAHDPPRQLARYVIMMMNVQSVLFYRTEAWSMTETSVVDYTYSLPVATTIFLLLFVLNVACPYGRCHFHRALSLINWQSDLGQLIDNKLGQKNSNYYFVVAIC